MEEEFDVNEAILIQLMRIYDVLMLDATKTYPEAARKLAAVHEAMKIVGPYPGLSGRLYDNEENEQ